MKQLILITLALSALVAGCAQKPAHDLPMPSGELVPLNTDVPTDYRGNGLPPVIGGVDQR